MPTGVLAYAVDMVAHSLSSNGSRNAQEPSLCLQLLRAIAQSVLLIVCFSMNFFCCKTGRHCRRDGRA